MSCRSLLRHPTSPLSACSCQQYASSKYIKQPYPERSQRKSVSPSLAIALTAGAASVAVVLTATLAVYFLMYHLDSSIITSTTSNRVVSTTTHSTALSGARLLDNATYVQTSIRGSLDNPLVQTQNDDVKDRKLEISTIAGKGDAGAWPKVAWLMSFPNSGTSYTLHLTRTATNTTTASNYALEGDIKNESSIPIHHDAVTGGPFLELTPNRPTSVPTTYILTKTHCGGFCSDCKPHNYLETPRSFQILCQSGTRAFIGRNGTLEVELVTYDSTLVKKAVHVIRNPLDNIVARFHLEWERYRNEGKIAWIEQYAYNRTGFHNWCRQKDSVSLVTQFRWVDRKLLSLMKAIPCQEEFLRYVQWHNLAFGVTRDIGIPTLVIHYQEYRDDWENTVTKLLNFLELPRNGVGESFDHGKEYSSYYTDDQRAAIKAFIQEYATTETWENVKDYN